MENTTYDVVPFHPGSLAPAGAPAPMLEDVSSTGVAGEGFAFARNGTFVYLVGKATEAVWPISCGDSAG